MIQKLYKHMGQYKKMILICVLLTVGEVICELMIPLFMAKIVDNGIPAKDAAYIGSHGAIMVLFAVTAIALGVCNAKFSADASQGFAYNLRKALFDKTQAFSFANIDEFSGASLITRMTGDVTLLQNSLMMSLRILTRAPIMLVSALFIAMSINFRLSTVIFVSIGLLVLGISFIGRRAGKLFALMQQKIDGLNSCVQENLIAIRVVKAFVREDHERVKFEKASAALSEVAMKAGGTISLVMPVMMSVLYGTTIAVLWMGGNYVGQGNMSTGGLMSFISYIMQILMSVMMFAMIFIMLTRAKACGDRVVEVLDTQPDITDKDQAGKNLPPAGKIEFENVSFRYKSGRGDVLSNISFTAEPGELVGIVGGTGSGKSSLISLIPRFYDVTSGSVKVNEIDVRDYKQEDLRGIIGMVMQKNNLFSGTIKENLLWGNDQASVEELIESAKDAQAHEFIESFPDGYDTMLGQGGVNVSGGQKQRLCIARAMLKAPSILILDDSTSAVDTATEAKIRRSFYKNFQDTTVLVVAQRISSVQDADRIIVLDGGEISGIGTHEQLLESNRVYGEIYNSQMEGVRE